MAQGRHRQRGQRTRQHARQHARRSPGWRPRRPAIAAVAALALGIMLAACSAAASPQRVLAFSGPEEGLLVNADGINEIVVEVSATFEGDADLPDGDDAVPPIDDIVLLLDGEDVTADAEVSAATLTWTPGTLPDGDYTLEILSIPPVDDNDTDDDADSGDAEADDDPDTDTALLQTYTFAIDTTPPEIALDGPEGPLVAGESVTFVGSTEPGATVEVVSGGQREEAVAGDDGGFEVELSSAPQGPVTLIATDAAGNVGEGEASFVVVPSRATVDEIRSVHVSFCAWASPELREAVLDLVDAGLINSVQLDLKDETGMVGYDTEVAFAERIGSNAPDCRIDLEAAIEFLHDLELPVIGRIVAFADPVIAPWAWENDERDLAIQTADGSTYYTGRYNGFANFANPEVIAYNIDIAEEAAAMGVDHILWDYLRKPDGPLENMRIPGLETDVEDAIVEFTRLADERLAPYGIQHGASLYGVSADRPWEVGQDVERLGELLDYVSPMIYPSHWGPNEYGVDDPLMQPGDMVAATLAVWQEVTDGQRARVVPWLEDSNWPIRLGFPDRERYVREQIQATYDAGINEWLLWDSSVRYTTEAIDPPPGG